MRLLAFTLVPGLLLLSCAASARQVQDIRYILKTGMLQTLVAKELCSCHFVSGLGEKECYEQNNLGATVLDLLSVKIDEEKKTVRVRLPTSWGDGSAAVARWQSARFGCVLVKRPQDPLTN